MSMLSNVINYKYIGTDGTHFHRAKREHFARTKGNTSLMQRRTLGSYQREHPLCSWHVIALLMSSLREPRCTFSRLKTNREMRFLQLV